MKTLLPEDLLWCVNRLPKILRTLMKKRPDKLIVAGGFIRSCIANETINDIDVFSPSEAEANYCVSTLLIAGPDVLGVVKTENALTICTKPYPIQFVHKWVFAKPGDVIPSFDFTIAKAAIWYDGQNWRSLCDDRFYQDLAAKRLIYCSPIRNEAAGGSLLRVLKFYQRGYRIPLDSLGAVLSRLVQAVDMPAINSFSVEEREKQIAKVLTGLLREVDPNIDPEHISHLPSTEQTIEENNDTSTATRP